jgi:hypothetical protein
MKHDTVQVDSDSEKKISHLEFLSLRNTFYEMQILRGRQVDSMKEKSKILFCIVVEHLLKKGVIS